MRVFVTGASGWIGSAVTDELLAAGHEVEGLVRSDAAAATLAGKGAGVRRGDLDDLDGIRAGAEAADAVVHLANKHDWSNLAATNASERAAVQTIGDALVGSDRPFLVASGLAALAEGRPAVEADASPFHGVESMRGGGENLALDYAERGVRPVAVRFAPTVHGMNDHGFISTITGIARDKGVAGYPGDGQNRWAAVHRSDAARLVVLGLDAPAGTRLHAVAEVGVTMQEIAEAIGAASGLPVRSIPSDEVAEHFGWIGGFVGMSMAAGSDATQALLGWTPTGPTLVEDIAAGAYA